MKNKKECCFCKKEIIAPLYEVEQKPVCSACLEKALKKTIKEVKDGGVIR